LINQYPDIDVGFAYYHKHIYKVNSIDAKPFFSPSHILVEEANKFIKTSLHEGNFAAVQWRMEKTHLSWFRHLMPAVLTVVHQALAKYNFPVVRIILTSNNSHAPSNKERD